uniref:Uncharacterized protein n=1 Tax=Caenorhabditis tropicalis TaxID=1561998 RepID=A0A1I7T8F2_9PELO
MGKSGQLATCCLWARAHGVPEKKSTWRSELLVLEGQSPSSLHPFIHILLLCRPSSSSSFSSSRPQLFSSFLLKVGGAYGFTNSLIFEYLLL